MSDHAGGEEVAAGISLPGPEVTIPAAPRGFVMNSDECGDLEKWLGRAKDRDRKFHVSHTWEFAAGLGVTSLFAFLTTQYVGLTDDTGNRTGVDADSWVAPFFLVVGLVALLWALLAYMSGKEERSRMEDLVSDCEQVLTRVKGRHPEAGG